MSTTVSYKGSTIATVSNDTKTLLTEGKYLEDDLTLVDVSGGGAVLTTKNISANGTYNASSDSADGYSQVNVSVPNTYSAGDEGKVVSNGALVAQTSNTVTENDTYDTTLINSLTVNVPSSGGLTPLASGTVTGTGSYDMPISIGKKMAKTDFWIKVIAKPTAEYTYDTDYKEAVYAAVVFSELAHFDIATVGERNITSDLSFPVNNGGTITNVNVGSYNATNMTVRQTSASYIRFPEFKVKRTASEFSIRLYNPTAAYKTPTAITYDWEVVYFGSNPATDIYEIV